MAVDKELLASILDAIRPSLRADGGDLEFVDVDSDGVVSLRLLGACAGCSLSDFTLSGSIERVVRAHVPGVTAVKAVE